MYESVRNLLLAGLGAAVLTKEKVLEATRQFVDQGRMTAAEAERVAEEVVEESRQQAKSLGESLAEKVEAGVKRAVEALDLVNRQEFDQLSARLAQLELAVARLEERLASSPPSR
jgi:polyhydroxyalkanoate synthesis regulator phasin